jgi:hypothetical protein
MDLCQTQGKIIGLGALKELQGIIALIIIAQVAS